MSITYEKKGPFRLKVSVVENFRARFAHNYVYSPTNLQMLPTPLQFVTETHIRSI